MYWAEVVVPSPKMSREEEWRSRKEGKIAVRLLTRADSDVLSANAAVTLNAEDPVALIDVRVFVPEVVSVLNTFSHPRFKEQLTDMKIIGHLLGQEDNHGTYMEVHTTRVCYARARKS